MSTSTKDFTVLSMSARYTACPDSTVAQLANDAAELQTIALDVLELVTEEVTGKLDGNPKQIQNCLNAVLYMSRMSSELRALVALEKHAVEVRS